MTLALTQWGRKAQAQGGPAPWQPWTLAIQDNLCPHALFPAMSSVCLCPPLFLLGVGFGKPLTTTIVFLCWGCRTASQKGHPAAPPLRHPSKEGISHDPTRQRGMVNQSKEQTNPRRHPNLGLQNSFLSNLRLC